MLPFTTLAESLPASVPFVGPERIARDSGIETTARIGANESVFGPSPKAIAAMQEAVVASWAYGDPEHFELRTAIAGYHGVAPENIVVGEGVDGLLGLLVRLIVENDTVVATSAGAYPTFNYHVNGFGGRLVTVPYCGDHEDPDALASLAVEENAALVYFANPDNPMGSVHPAAVVQKLIDATPEHQVLCLDEAYVDFAPDGTAPAIDVTRKNIIRFRTFSKAYGMAGIRVGYGIAHADLASAFNKIRNHFGVSRVAQAGALAALADQDYLHDVVARTARSRARIAEIAAANGLEALPSATNFVAVDCKGDATFAKGVVDGLARHGIFIRMPFVAPQNRCVRISAGTDAHLDLLEAALPQVLGELRQLGADGIKLAG
ncbi:MAG: pyridoxal phosphate-dependent aminotransferase [Pseudomonadota bacterium]